MSFELVLFVIVAAVAIFSAALMLVSRNAVHAALYLVINLLCVSFFYLMLNAPFLAMVQVTVYAGAIMVLFMFVIMLLGSERLSGGSQPFSWIVPGAVGLTTLFLLIVFLAIAQGQIGSLQPVPRSPEVRFVHAVANAPALDVYLNNDLVAGDLAFREPTDFEQVRAGTYNLLVFPACEEASRADCPDPMREGAPPLLALPYELKPETATTLVVSGTPDKLALLSVPTDLSTLADENTYRLTFVHAAPGIGPVTVNRVEPGNSAVSETVIPDLTYGNASQTLVFPRGRYDFDLRQGEARIATVREFNPRSKTHEMYILLPEPVLNPGGAASIRPALFHVEKPGKTLEAYGSPQEIGQELLTNYVLPFEMVALLLLASMVGAIILTREEVVRRVRKRLVVSQAIKRINRSLAASAPANVAQTTSSDVTGTSGAESSAD